MARPAATNAAPTAVTAIRFELRPMNQITSLSDGAMGPQSRKGLALPPRYLAWQVAETVTMENHPKVADRLA